MSSMSELHHELTTTTTTAVLTPDDVRDGALPAVLALTADHPVLGEVMAHVVLALQVGCTVTVTTTPSSEAECDPTRGEVARQMLCPRLSFPSGKYGCELPERHVGLHRDPSGQTWVL